MKKDAPALFVDDELPPMPGKIETQAYEIYNEVAGRVGWTKAQKLTPDRCKKLLRAVKDVGGLAEWRKALERGGCSTFLTTKFRPDLEFVTRLPKLTKMAEGGFDDQGTDTATGKRSIAAQSGPADEWGRYLRDYRLKGFWPAWLGPRPEDPGCRAPAAMLEACRKRLGIEVKARPVETEEERLAASIVSLRRHGFWERANKAEERLAKLQGRPPVLVPAPEVAHMGMPERPLPAGSGRPRRGPLSEVDEHGRTSPADAERERRMAHHALSEPPEYDGVPEGEQYEDAEA